MPERPDLTLVRRVEYADMGAADRRVAGAFAKILERRYSDVRWRLDKAVMVERRGATRA